MDSKVEKQMRKGELLNFLFISKLLTMNWIFKMKKTNF